MDDDTASLERQEAIAFDETFQRVLKDLVPSTATSPDAGNELAEVYRWLEKVMNLGLVNSSIPDWVFIQAIQYNVPHGKRNRGLAVIMTYRLLASPQEQTPENLELARVLGWCVELLQAYFLVSDDIMDQAITRRGQLCWYRQVKF